MKKIISIALMLFLLTGSVFAGTPAVPFPVKIEEKYSKAWYSPNVQSPGLGQWISITNEYLGQMKKPYSDKINKIVEKFETWDENFYRTYPDSNIGYIQGHITGEVVEWGYSSQSGNGDAYQPISASEHTGYGMIIYSLMAGYDGSIDCQERFNSLARLYYQLKLDNNLMCWAVPKINWDTFKNQEINRGYWDWNPNTEETELNFRPGKPELVSSATDGDFDIAYAFLLASKQWPDANFTWDRNNDGDLSDSEDVNVTYKKLALDMIDQGIANDLITPIDSDTTLDLDDGLILLGDWHSLGLKENWWSGTQKEVYMNTTRSSDLMLENLRIFKEVSESNKDVFENAIQLTYKIVEDFNSQNNNTGLLTDFIHKTNGTYGPASQAIYDELHEPFPVGAYSENSCRVPQRFALDFIHNDNDNVISGNENKIIENATRNLADFAKNKIYDGTAYHWEDIVAGYDIASGNPVSTSDGLDALQFASCFASSTVATDNTPFKNSGFDYLYESQASGNVSNDAYFKDTLTLMNLLIMENLWWDYRLDLYEEEGNNFASWKPDRAYNGGECVSYNEEDYVANWWSINEKPPVSQAWDQIDSTVKHWHPDAVYESGDYVIYNDLKYVAKWWTQGENPETSGTWDVWEKVE